MDKSIPVLGTAIVNGPHWMQRLIESVDYPVDEMVIFDNNGRGQLTKQLDEMAKVPHPFIKKIKVCHLPTNIGCPDAWNLIIKCYMNAPYWIIVNHDIAFTPGFLEEMVQKAEDPEVGMVHASAGDFENVGSFELFLLKDWVVQKVGLFDENFYPAYCEDADYIMKLNNLKIKRAYGISKPYYHGETMDYYVSGAQTKRTEGLWDRLEEVNQINFEYMTKKWGAGWRWMSPWPYPYNDPNMPFTITSFDLDYVRRKHLGF
jgi:GT2 family glycosyltransferase